MQILEPLSEIQEKLKEEIAPGDKKEAAGPVPIQDAIEPLESIAEQADEADKSITTKLYWYKNSANVV